MILLLLRNLAVIKLTFSSHTYVLYFQLQDEENRIYMKEKN